MASPHIDRLLIILGKRLNDNRITREGVARVTAAIAHLKQHGTPHTAVAFCGGIAPGQVKAEAMAFYAEFRKHWLALPEARQIGPLFFDPTSGNTIENIKNITNELIASQLLNKGDRLDIQLVTSEYHLYRIITIQQYMDEQGLLRVVQSKSQELQIDLRAEPELHAHVPAPYPYGSSALGQIYEQVDRLTIYRVFLEGVVNSAFQELSLDEIRAKPLNEATAAIVKIRGIIADHSDLKGKQPSVILAAAQCLEVLIDATCRNTTDIPGHLAFFHSTLTTLNRYVDPEG